MVLQENENVPCHRTAAVAAAWRRCRRDPERDRGGSHRAQSRPRALAYGYADALEFASMEQHARIPHFLVELPRRRDRQRRFRRAGRRGRDRVAGSPGWGEGFATEAARALVDLARFLGHENWSPVISPTTRHPARSCARPGSSRPENSRGASAAHGRRDGFPRARARSRGNGPAHRVEIRGMMPDAKGPALRAGPLMSHSAGISASLNSPS